MLQNNLKNLKIFLKNKKSKGVEINPEDIFLDSSNLLNLDNDKQEASLERPISRFIEYLPAIFIILAFSIFSYRLYILQIENRSFYEDKANNNRYNSQLILANRGEIFDRQGVTLSTNIISSTTDILKREYIQTGGFANLLGYVAYPKKDDLGNYWQDTYLGRDGVELIYQDLLDGTNGRQIIEKDVKAGIESENLKVEAIPGVNLELTVDANLQERLYSSLKSVVENRGFISATGIIMDVNTGEILAITNFPEYDNNLMTNASGEEDNKKIKALLQDKRTPFLNRAVSGLFTPGSVVKPFMAYAALNEKVITPEEQILSTGQIVIKNIYDGPDTIFRDWKAHGYINVVRALAESSDEYFYQVGGGYKTQAGLGIARIDEYAKLFGLDSLTKIDLPNESNGIIPTPEWKRINFLDGEWRVGDTYHTAIGQYGFQITPVELIRYIAVVANGGKLVTPHIFLSASSSNSLANLEKVKEYNAKEWPVTDLKLNEYALKYIKEGMREVVLANGTVPQLNIPGLNMAAKSGTAEIGTVKGKVNSLMTGYFPYDNPKYAFTVVVENGPEGAPSPAAQAIKPVLEYMAQNLNKYLK